MPSNFIELPKVGCLGKLAMPKWQRPGRASQISRKSQKRKKRNSKLIDLHFLPSVEMLQAIKYSQGHLEILDQLQLPFVEKYIPIQTAEDGWHAIKDMKVRGAPAIAIVAMLALSVELHSRVAAGNIAKSADETRESIAKKLAYLVTSRPTAVNLSDASRKLEALVTAQAKQPDATSQTVVNAFLQAAEEMLGKDLEDNQRIGHNGADWIVAHAAKPGSSNVAVLTHCNTGSVPTMRLSLWLILIGA